MTDYRKEEKRLKDQMEKTAIKDANGNPIVNYAVHFSDDDEWTAEEKEEIQRQAKEMLMQITWNS